MHLVDDVLSALRLSVESVASDPEACARSPGRDFTRNRKLGLRSLLLLIVTMGTDTLGMELAGAWGLSAGAPTVGALCQQWAKLNDEAMPRLHREFLSRFDPVPTAGHWLLACDGTKLALAPDASDAATRMRPAKGREGHNSCHLTCAYDVARGVFTDMVCQGGRSLDEHAAAWELVDRCEAPDGMVALWVLDRGFWSLNLAWHMRRAGAHYVCRLKECVAEQLLRAWSRGRRPAVGTVDADVEVCVTRSPATARTRPGEPWLYRFYGRGRRFDGLAPGEPGECWLSLRVVRLRTPTGWLCLATNLPRDGFPPSAVAATYARRWEEETAFGELKHTVGLECPHVRTLARVAQEAWGRLTLHAACALSAACVPAPADGRATDRTACFKLVARHLRGAAVDVVRACARLTQAVRPGRGFRRRKRPPSPPSFTNRH